MPMTGFFPGDIHGLHQIPDGFVQAHGVNPGALLEVLDRQMLGATVGFVGKHAAACQTHRPTSRGGELAYQTIAQPNGGL
jgi:hypothetical protein